MKKIKLEKPNAIFLNRRCFYFNIFFNETNNELYGFQSSIYLLCINEEFGFLVEKEFEDQTFRSHL